MRKAFDANVPRLRPRLKSATLGDEHGAELEADLAPAPGSTGAETPSMGEGAIATALEAAVPVVAETALQPEPVTDGVEQPEVDAPPQDLDADPPPPRTRKASAQRSLPALAEAAPPTPARAPSAAPEPAASPFLESTDVQSRRERLLKIKRKVAAAARPSAPMPALPETPGRAGESALALVRDLEVQLQRSRESEAALRADLDQARAELARGAADARRGAERLTIVEKQVEEKRAVLEEMLAEMSALEEERDGAVARAQALTALDEERQALLDNLSARTDDSERKRADAEAEVARLGTELEERAADAARLRAALAQVTRERDDLAREALEAKRERDELAEARKALEQVHEALATARSRLT